MEGNAEEMVGHGGIYGRSAHRNNSSRRNFLHLCFLQGTTALRTFEHVAQQVLEHPHVEDRDGVDMPTPEAENGRVVTYNVPIFGRSTATVQESRAGGCVLDASVIIAAERISVRTIVPASGAPRRVSVHHVRLHEVPQRILCSGHLGRNVLVDLFDRKRRSFSAQNDMGVREPCATIAVRKRRKRKKIGRSSQHVENTVRVSEDGQCGQMTTSLGR